MTFDLHTHPAFKNFLNEYYTEYPTSFNYNNEKLPYSLQNKVLDGVHDLFLHILEGQSSVSQLQVGKVRRCVTAISNVELGFAASGGLFGNLLGSKWAKILDLDYFEKVEDGEISYLRLLIKEVDFYQKLVNNSKGKLSFLSRDHVIDPEERHVQFILALEGGHNLSKKLIGNNLKFDPLNDSNIKKGEFNLNNSNFNHSAANNLRELTQVLRQKNIDILYLTLTHLTHIEEQNLATHAFGLKMIKHSAFFPHGRGVSKQGFEVIKTAYTLEHEGARRPILIDVKHMSLVSRLQFYEYRSDHFDTMPIIASHVGIAGYSIKEWKESVISKDLRRYHYETAKCVEVVTERKKAGEWGSFLNKNFTFNPWTINLLDDDIIQILESKGLIGISLDVRILGFQSRVNMKSKSAEYLSESEFSYLFPKVDRSKLRLKEINVVEHEMESWTLPTKEERHPLCLCFNLIHIMTVGQAKLHWPWADVSKHICIGSDFDGLIQAIKVCEDASEFPDLRGILHQWLPVAAASYQKENGYDDEMYQYAYSRSNRAKFIDNFLWKSSDEFLKRWKSI